MQSVLGLYSISFVRWLAIMLWKLWVQTLIVSTQLNAEAAVIWQRSVPRAADMTTYSSCRVTLESFYEQLPVSEWHEVDTHTCRIS